MTTVRTLSTTAELAAAAALFGRVWGGGASPLGPELLRAFEMSGNYVSGAFSDRGELAGACAGFVEGPAHDGAPALHSHVAAVLPEHRGHGVGLALKLHQREWALAHGIATIVWTFDPLVRRNAIFNLSRLAARVTRYEVNCYGELGDEINRGGDSDRVVVAWELESPAVTAAVGGTVLVVDGAVAGRRTWGAPEDVEALRRSNPHAAAAARLEARAALVGSRIVGVDAAGAYVLERQ